MSGAGDYGAWTRVLVTSAEATVVGHRGLSRRARRRPGVGSGFHARRHDQRAKRAAVMFDGAHYVTLMGCFDAGIWRYVEP
jgi:hypothetical protein